MAQIWDILQIEATTDKREIKKAYARQAKVIHPEEKPEEFQMLYEAYQRALQYASSGRGGKRISFEMPQAEPEKEPENEEQENREPTERQDEYERLGFSLEAAEKEQFRLREIEYFLRGWKRQLIVWGNNGMFLNEEWKQYLQSETFREIMWSPIVLETMVPGIKRYCMQKEEILLFFWDLYGFENLEGRRLEGAGLQLCRILYPAYTNRVKRQQHGGNRGKLKKKENSRIRKLLMSIICVVAGVIICAIFLVVYHSILEIVWLIWQIIQG